MPAWRCSGLLIVSRGALQHIHAIIVILKRELLEAIHNANTVKVWIQLNIPRISDGDNFGVSIQEETVAELNRTEESCYAMLDGIGKYYTNRSKLCSKVASLRTVAAGASRLGARDALCAPDLQVSDH